MRDPVDYLGRTFNAEGVVAVVRHFVKRWIVINALIAIVLGFLAAFAGDILTHRNERAADIRSAKEIIFEKDRELQTLLASRLGPALYEGEPFTPSDVDAISKASDRLFPAIDLMDQTDERIRRATERYERSVSDLKQAVRNESLDALDGVTRVRAVVNEYAFAQEDFENEIELYLDNWFKRMWN